MTDVSVALEVMRSDATAWSSAADALEAPRSAIGGLALTGADVSMWAADRGLHRTYDHARTALEDMLVQAATAFHAMAASLRAAADTYEGEQHANHQAFDRLHQGER